MESSHVITSNQKKEREMYLSYSYVTLNLDYIWISGQWPFQFKWHNNLDLGYSLHMHE